MEILEVRVLTRKDVGQFCKKLLGDARQLRDTGFCVDAAESCEKESRKTNDSFVKGELEKCRKRLVQWSASLAGANSNQVRSSFRGY